MRLSEKTPVIAVLVLVLAVTVGLGFWYMDVRQQAQTQQALEQTREAFERLERERKGESASVANTTTPGQAASSVVSPTVAAVPGAPDSRPTRETEAGTRAGTAPEIYYLLVALLLTALVALAVAGSSYRLVRRERRARMEEDRLARTTGPERASMFRDSGVTIIDAETVETITAEEAPDERSPAPPARGALDQLRDWIQDSPQPALVMQPSGEMVSVNAALTRATGYTQKDLPNLQAWLARALRIAPDAQAAARDALRDRYAQRADAPAEMTVWTRAGEARHWLAHTAPVSVDGDTAWLLFATDVSEQRQSQHAAIERAASARDQADELAAIYQAAPVGLAVLDAQKRFLRVNDKLAEMTGLRAVDHTGKTLRKLLPHVAAGAEALVEHALQTGTQCAKSPIAVRTPAQPKAERCWAVSCTPVKDPDGRVTHLVLAAEDVTERHQAEAYTRESERSLRAMLEHLPAPVCVKDAQGRYVYANPAYEAFVHAAAGELKGRMDHDVLPWEAADRLREHDEEALAAPRAVESRGTAPFDGGAVHFTASKMAMRDADGKPYAVCCVYRDWTTEQQAEAGIKASEARYRAIFESSPQPMFIDRDNRLEHVNEACMRLLAARDSQQLLGRSILEFVQQPWHQAFQERIQRALRRKAADGPLEVKLTRLDGGIIDGEIEATLYETPAERAVQILVRDVTARRSAEEALRRSESQLRQAAEETPALIRLSDADGSVTYWNASWERHTGVPADQALGQRWTHHVHAEDRERVARAALDSRAQRDPIHVEYRLRDRAGDYRWVLDVVRARFDDAGTCLGHIGSMLDITDRRQAEARFARDAERLRAVAELAPAALWIENDRRCEYVNAAMRDELGLPASGDGDGDWTARIHPDDRAGYVERRRAAGAQHSHIPLRVQRADGEYRRMLASLAPCADGGGAGWIGCLTDLTELERAQQAVQEADQRRNAYVAALAAEMRAPMEPLRHAAEVLRMVGLPEPRAQQASDIVVRHAQYLARLLEDAIDVSSLLESTPVLRRSAVEIGTLVHRAAAAARPLIEARGQSLALTLPAGRTQIDADPDRIAQALTRLLDYCARCAPPRGALSVLAEESDADVVLRVRAAELALPQGEPEALFDLFPYERNRHGEAAGISLPLVRKLVEMHDGSVSARGDAHGVEFVLRLPASRGTREAAPESAAVAGNGHRRVLVVDHDPDTAASLRMLLQLQGHDVRVANDRAAAVPAAREFHPDTVLIDTGADIAGDGELARALRLLPETAHAALLGVTSEDHRDEAVSDGAFDRYLVKPVEPQLLQQLLAETSPTLH